jgi:predicted ATPase
MNTTNQTKGIGFKNFRKFENFPMLEFGNITYMVGRNNSGKSTMVKALLLVMDYLQNQLSDTFSFDNDVLEDANIVTFGRAKNNISTTPVIEFNFKLHQYDINIIISGEDDNTTVNVNSLSIDDKKNGYYLSINYNNNTTTLKRKEKKEEVDEKLDEVSENAEKKKLTKEIHELEEEIEKEKDTLSSNLLKKRDLLNILRTKLEKISLLKEAKKDDEDFTFEHTYPIEYQLLKPVDYFIDMVDSLPDDYQEKLQDSDQEKDEADNSDIFDEIVKTEENNLKELISLFLYHNNTRYSRLIDHRKTEGFKDPDDFADVLEIYNLKDEIKDWIEDLVQTISKESFFYLGANPSKQSALFPLRAKDNALAQAIHEFKQLGILKGDKEWAFVKDWMKEFEVGVDFEINFYAGEAYEFHVYNSIEDKEKGKYIHLADKGMGSLQAMLLILHVASLIRKNKKGSKKITLLVEEPELNLHPALQSKLTEFFHEVNFEYGFNFIVETHSEYIIRKAQLMALEQDYISNQELNPNPFKIVYFHKDEGPYEMKFNEQGKFEREFGKGFYDEASNMTMSLIKEIRKKQ